VDGSFVGIVRLCVVDAGSMFVGRMLGLIVLVGMKGVFRV